MPSDPAPHSATAQRRRLESRALSGSLLASVGLAAAALVLGVVTGTRIIVLDGAYMAIGMVLSWASLRAARAAASGPTRRFPFGRDALAPLMVVVQGLALAGTLVVAFGDALVAIRDGGSEANLLVISLYGLVTGLVGFAVAWWLSRAAAGSDLVAAEAAQWRAGSVLSVIMVVGGVAVALLQLTPARELGRFADPALVIVACGVLAPVPVGLLRSGLNELLEGAPPPELATQIAAAIESVRAARDLPEPVLRAQKLGFKVYVEVDFVVAERAWTVAEEDEVRRAVLAALQDVELDVWATVAVTLDPAMAE